MRVEVADSVICQPGGDRGWLLTARYGDFSSYIAFGDRTTLKELFEILKTIVRGGSTPPEKPVYREFRPGDIRHSLADIGKASRLLGFSPTHRIDQGLALSIDWYRRNVV
jgi:UDP-N-acetylglucosamine/UDP-N-acetyl-alpha-D-glucosaminouronate 4-epimerase